MRWLPRQLATQVQRDTTRDLQRRQGTTATVTNTVAAPAATAASDAVCLELWFSTDYNRTHLTPANFLGHIPSIGGCAAHFLQAAQDGSCLRVVGYVATGTTGGTLTVPVHGKSTSGIEVKAYPLGADGLPGTPAAATVSGINYSVTLAQPHTSYAVVIESWQGNFSEAYGMCRLLLAAWTLPSGTSWLARREQIFGS